MNIVNNVAGAVHVSLSYRAVRVAARSALQQTFGRKPVTVELISDIPGVDFQISDAQIPIVTGSDGVFQVDLSFSPYVNGTYVNGSTASLRISIDDVGSEVSVPFLFVANQANCALPPAPPASCLTVTRGFMSVFTGTYKTADMRMWTPWFPRHWSSSRHISLNFTLNSMNSISSPSFVCNRNYSRLLVFTAPQHICNLTSPVFGLIY